MNDNILTILKKLRERCEQADETLIQELGLSPAEFQFFQASMFEPNIDNNMIAARTGLSPSRLSRIIDKMVQNGYLTRTENKDDRRAICIAYTNKGNEIKQRLELNRQTCEAKLSAHLTEEQRRDLAQSLKFLIENL